MDLYCLNCGEPWAMDSLHDEAGERYGVPFYLDENDRRAYRRNPAYDPDAYQAIYAQVSLEFRSTGCAALASIGARCTTTHDPDDEPGAKPTRAAAAAAMYELLGDDLDGAAAMLEDFEAGC